MNGAIIQKNHLRIYLYSQKYSIEYKKRTTIELRNTILPCQGFCQRKFNYTEGMGIGYWVSQCVLTFFSLRRVIITLHTIIVLSMTNEKFTNFWYEVTGRSNLNQILLMGIYMYILVIQCEGTWRYVESKLDIKYYCFEF